MIVLVVREIVKLCMFILLWALPLALAYHYESNGWLWLFIASAVMTGGVFSHYEDLANFERTKKEEVENHVEENTK